MGRLRAVVPVLIGEHAFGGGGGGGGGGCCCCCCASAAGGHGDLLIGPLFGSRAYLRISAAVHASVNEQARRVLHEMGVEPSALLPGRSIKGVVEDVSRHLGVQATSISRAPPAAGRGVRHGRRTARAAGGSTIGRPESWCRWFGRR